MLAYPWKRANSLLTNNCMYIHAYKRMKVLLIPAGTELTTSAKGISILSSGLVFSISMDTVTYLFGSPAPVVVTVVVAAAVSLLVLRMCSTILEYSDGFLA